MFFTDEGHHNQIEKSHYRQMINVYFLESENCVGFLFVLMYFFSIYVTCDQTVAPFTIPMFYHINVSCLIMFREMARLSGHI